MYVELKVKAVEVGSLTRIVGRPTLRTMWAVTIIIRNLQSSVVKARNFGHFLHSALG